MSEKTSGIYHLTQIPNLYEIFQSLLGGTAARRKIVNEYIRPVQGQHILDLGCGSAAILPFLGNIQYTGIDRNAEHIAKAKATYRERGRFHAGDFVDLPKEMAGSFNTVLCLGFLHHLSDQRVNDVCNLAKGYLADGGRFIAVDPAFDARQPWLARKLAEADSGQHVRTEAHYKACVAAVFGSCDTHIRHNLLRIPYTHCITVATRAS